MSSARPLRFSVITVAAAEAAIAWASSSRCLKNRETVNVDEIDLMKW